LLLLASPLAAQATAPAIRLQFDPAKTVAEITLSATMHTVHGTFSVKRGAVNFDPDTGIVSGEVVFDATSGKTGIAGRDQKMHKDVLESQRYPDITFRPDHAEGHFAVGGVSTLNVHGLLAIHGAPHEVTFPVQINVNNDRWSATSSFTIPYVQWGMKNPSNFFLKVHDEVEVHTNAGGQLAGLTH